jgi:hypothetical protein
MKAPEAETMQTMTPKFRPGLARLALLLVCTPTVADDAPWLRCRSIADAAARLICYDAVRPAPVQQASQVPAAAPSAPLRADPSAQQFGLVQRAPESNDAIHSRLEGAFEGWGPRQVFKLANGQVWQSVETSSAYYALRDPKVTIRRAMLGSFLMEIDGVTQAIRVRRVQ